MRMRYPVMPWVRPDTDPDIKEIILQYGTIREYKKNEIVVPSFYMYPYLSLIVGGALAKGFIVQDSTKHFSHSILFPGSLVGTYYFMTKNITNLKIVAIRNATLIEAPHEAVYSHMMRNSAFMKKILNHTAMDLISDSEGLATVSSRPSEEKLKILMKILMIRFNVKPENGWYKVPFHLTHQEMSRVIYTTQLTINRIIMKNIKKGLVKDDSKGRYIHRDFFNDIYDWNPDDPAIRLN